MKIYLAAEDRNIKDNDPPGDFNTHFKGGENKSQQQKKCIHNNCPIPKYHERTFQPGKRQHLVGASHWFIVHFKIPQNHSHEEADIAQHSKF